jgi:hypothetical protein
MDEKADLLRAPALVVVLLAQLSVWFLAGGVVGTHCGESGMSEASRFCNDVRSGHLASWFLGAVAAVSLAGWLIARQRADVRWFGWIAGIAFAANVVVAILAVLWASGDYSWG